MKLATIVGARPQFVKASAISTCLRDDPAFASIENVLVHTGQHYDHEMSRIFFDELQIDERTIYLGISGGSHAEMTGRMLQAIEPVLIAETPDCLLIYGDTNSTLAAALAAAKLGFPIAHVEAGLRSFNRSMPEEINRVIADHLSTHLYCPTVTAAENLAREGITTGVSTPGDVMYDVALRIGDSSGDDVDFLSRFGITNRNFALATFHRAENTNDLERLEQILTALDDLAEHLPVQFPIHPRTRAIVEANNLGHLLHRVRVMDPLGFVDMLRLERSAKFILTDSGGVQKEAYFYGTPCITARDETEWVETVTTGWNLIVGASRQNIVSAALGFRMPTARPEVYGNGTASRQILLDLLSHYHS